MSGRKFLPDTNIVIGLLKAHPASLAAQLEWGIDLGNSAVSQVTRMELLSFPELSENEEALIRAFLNSCEVVLIDEEIEEGAIDIRKALGIKLPDAVIAASAH